MDSTIINDRLEKLKELKLILNSIDEKILSLTKEFNWDYEKLLEEKATDMVTCSINQQHRVPASKLENHKEKCLWHHQGYSDNDKPFPEHSGRGSFVTISEEKLQSITENLPSAPVLLYAVFLFLMMELKSNQLYQSRSNSGSKAIREVPQTSANYDQNFSREEKLAIYDYVIENTQKQISYSDLWLEPSEKAEVKKEMTAWEIAAAERDAKRRRASYRNKVHTNRKTQTEILREVIEVQMDALKEEAVKKVTTEGDELERKRSGIKQTVASDGSKHHYFSSQRKKEHRDKGRSQDKHSKHREHKRSPSYSKNDTKSRSRSHDKYRKWMNYEGRSHSHRSSHTHRR